MACKHQTLLLIFAVSVFQLSASAAGRTLEMSKAENPFFGYAVDANTALNPNAEEEMVKELGCGSFAEANEADPPCQEESANNDHAPEVAVDENTANGPGTEGANAADLGWIFFADANEANSPCQEESANNDHAPEVAVDENTANGPGTEGANAADLGWIFFADANTANALY